MNPVDRILLVTTTCAVLVCAAAYVLEEVLGIGV